LVFAYGLLVLFVQFNVVTSCPNNFNQTAEQKIRSYKLVRKEVRRTTRKVLNIAENLATDKEAFAKIAKLLKVENSVENFMQFQSVVNEMSDASNEACYGSPNSLVHTKDTSTWIDKYNKAINEKKFIEARNIFGRLLCLRQIFHTSIAKAINHSSTLDMWFDKLNNTEFSPLFNFTEGIPQSLAFVVDDTLSMSEEIDAVKEIINTIIKAQKASPDFYYILGTFNDPGNDNQC